MNKNYGTSRQNPTIEPKLPKNETKRMKQLAIREFAANNGISIKVARIMLQEDEEV